MLQAFIANKDLDRNRKHDYFLKLVEEVGELADAIRQDSRMGDADSIKGTIEEELYDVLYYILALANVYDVDIERCCRLKEQLNHKRYGGGALSR